MSALRRAIATALLYSACWAATQIREQVLPFFQSTSTVASKLKLLVCALALAAIHRQRDAPAIFGVTYGLSGLAILVTALTLKEW